MRARLINPRLSRGRVFISLAYTLGGKHWLSRNVHNLAVPLQGIRLHSLLSPREYKLTMHSIDSPSSKGKGYQSHCSITTLSSTGTGCNLAKVKSIRLNLSPCGERVLISLHLSKRTSHRRWAHQPNQNFQNFFYESAYKKARCLRDFPRVNWRHALAR
jgi:hypothetical protein